MIPRQASRSACPQSECRYAPEFKRFSCGQRLASLVLFPDKQAELVKKFQFSEKHRRATLESLFTVASEAADTNVTVGEFAANCMQQLRTSVESTELASVEISYSLAKRICLQLNVRVDSL